MGTSDNVTMDRGKLTALFLIFFLEKITHAEEIDAI